MSKTLTVTRYYPDDEMQMNINTTYQLNHSGISDVYIYKIFPDCEDIFDIVKWRINSRCLRKVIDKYKKETTIKMITEIKNDKKYTHIIVNNTKPFQPFISKANSIDTFNLILSCYSQSGTLVITEI